MGRIQDSYKRDIRHDKDYQATASGDYVTISGIDNVKQRLQHRLITEKGEIVHRPDFGVGINKYKNSVPTISTQRSIALDIKKQFGEDKDVEELEKVSVRFENNIFYIGIKVLIKGYGSTILEFEV